MVGTLPVGARRFSFVLAMVQIGRARIWWGPDAPGFTNNTSNPGLVSTEELETSIEIKTGSKWKLI